MLTAEPHFCCTAWASGAGPPVVALLKEGIAEAALCIMNLSMRTSEVKRVLVSHNSLELLANLLANGDMLAKEYAAGALLNMTAGQKEYAQAVQSCVPDLVNLLVSDSMQAAEWGAAALANVTRAGAEAQRDATERGAVPMLAELLHKVRANAQQFVILALTSLAENQPKVVAEGLSASKEKAKLREMRDRGSEEVADCIKLLLNTIGEDFL
eukprot:NODE_2010_length_1013_cov_293.352818.p3 GENE.NODE_2010_length_1013_cov_293.352818~~NODE_2010_length_1013_cov_293.352818.p3  ORF type:complete len:212 (+),score=84.27 NODE_2010_length_1013_cov_293.352818:83-718(+)